MAEWSWTSRNGRTRFTIFGKPGNIVFSNSDGLVRIDAIDTFVTVSYLRIRRTDIYVPLIPITFTEDEDHVFTNIRTQNSVLISSIPYVEPEDIRNFIESQLGRQPNRSRKANRIAESMENVFS